ncbi:unnamed protein product, partial [Medioppia subpectinata]
NLKYHEKKLLKKVNLDEWKKTNTTREQLVTSKYLLKTRDEYQKYNRIVGMIRKLSESIARLADNDGTKEFVVTVSSICQRRLPMVMVSKKMMPNFQNADQFVQQGHVKLGNRIVNDTSMLISRGMKEFVLWADHSKIRKKIEEFNHEYDDYNYI